MILGVKIVSVTGPFKREACLFFQLTFAVKKMLKKEIAFPLRYTGRALRKKNGKMEKQDLKK